MLEGDLESFQLRAGISVESCFCLLELYLQATVTEVDEKLLIHKKRHLRGFRGRTSVAGDVFAFSLWCEIVR